MYNSAKNAVSIPSNDTVPLLILTYDWIGRTMPLKAFPCALSKHCSNIITSQIKISYVLINHLSFVWNQYCKENVYWFAWPEHSEVFSLQTVMIAYHQTHNVSLRYWTLFTLFYFSHLAWYSLLLNRRHVSTIRQDDFWKLSIVITWWQVNQSFWNFQCFIKLPIETSIPNSIWIDWDTT